jgi:precorrin-3B synthase
MKAARPHSAAYTVAVIDRPTPPHREKIDRCPGALRAHQAADGLLARVRLPGGLLAPSQLRTLARAAAEWGEPRLELTGRGNIQIRGLAEGDIDALASCLADAGLLPSDTHERVRNIVASPLAGLDSTTELASLVTELDAELCRRARLAQLPGRFLFGLDDGCGDVGVLAPDLTIVATSAETSVAGFEVTRDDAVGTALALAEAFLDERAAQGSKAWRIAELDGGIEAVAARAVANGAVLVPTSVPAQLLTPERPAGLVAQVDGGTAVVVLVPLGRLTASQAALLAEHAGPRGLRVTPWRSVVLADVADPDGLVAAALAHGLGVDRSSPWYGLSACTGSPGCASALADVQTDATAEAKRWRGRRVHFSGCDRRCGRPADTQVDVIATDEGYVLSD